MSYTITLRSEDGSEEIFDCDADQYILDAAEEAGVDHPSSCRAGACSSCAMKIVEGEANQEAVKKVAPLVVDVTQSLIDAGESPECPSCGSLTLNFSEGCKTCESCGWSEC